MSKRILLATDGSPIADRALAEVIKFAVQGDAVHIVHVVEDPILWFSSPYGAYVDLDGTREAMLLDGKRLLSATQATLKDHGLIADTHLIDLHTGKGDIATAINEEAERWRADLIVLGTHGRRGMRRVFFGSVAEQILRTTDRPVLLVRGEANDAELARSGSGESGQ